MKRIDKVFDYLLEAGRSFDKQGRPKYDFIRIMGAKRQPNGLLEIRPEGFLGMPASHLEREYRIPKNPPVDLERRVQFPDIDQGGTVYYSFWPKEKRAEGEVDVFLLEYYYNAGFTRPDVWGREAVVVVHERDVGWVWNRLREALHGRFWLATISPEQTLLHVDSPKRRAGGVRVPHEYYSRKDEKKIGALKSLVRELQKSGVQLTPEQQEILEGF